MSIDMPKTLRPLLGLLIALALLISACGGGDDDDSADAATPSTQSSSQSVEVDTDADADEDAEADADADVEAGAEVEDADMEADAQMDTEDADADMEADADADEDVEADADAENIEADAEDADMEADADVEDADMEADADVEDADMEADTDAPDADAELELTPAEEADAEPAEAIEVSDDSVVLEYGDTSETLGEFNERFELVARSLAAQQGLDLNNELRTQLISFKPEFLDRRAVEVALLAEAEARGIEATDEDVQTQIDEEILPSLPEGETLETFIETAGFEDEEQLRNTLREDKLLQDLTAQLESSIEVTDEEIAASYEERQDEFAQPAQTCASHILLDTLEDAEAVLEELEGGADFAEVAQEQSTGPSAPQGGDLGCFGEGQMVAPFEEAAMNAEIGTPVGPVETEFGQHVILVTGRNEAGTASLEEVSDPIRQQLSQEKFGVELESIRESYNITTYPEVIIAETEAALAEAQAAAEAAAEEAAAAAEDAAEGEATPEPSEDEPEDASEDTAPADAEEAEPEEEMTEEAEPEEEMADEAEPEEEMAEEAEPEEETEDDN